MSRESGGHGVSAALAQRIIRLFVRGVLLGGISVIPVASFAQLHDEKQASKLTQGTTIENETAFTYIGDNGNTPAETVLGEDDNRGVFNEQIGLSHRRDDTDVGASLTLRMFPLSPRYTPVYFGSDAPEEAAYGFDNDARLERIWYHQKAGNVDVTFGDFSLTLGRGIAFHVNGEQSGWDQATVRGASLRFQKPGVLTLGGYGGYTNSINQDAVTRTLLDADAADTVFALEAKLHFAEALALGIHGVHLEPRFKSAAHVTPDRLFVDQGPGIRISTIGALLDFRLGGVSIYVEGNIQSHDNFRLFKGVAVKGETGTALFGKMKWDSGPRFSHTTLRVSAQGVAYRRFLSEGTFRSAYGMYSLSPVVRYHQMPTLEPDWVLIRSLGNETGGRVEGELRFKRTDTRVVASTSVVRYLGGIDSSGRWTNFEDVTAVHPVVQLVQPLRQRAHELTVTLGGRYEQTDMATLSFNKSGHLLHGSLTWSAQVNPQHFFELSTQLRRHRLGVQERNDSYWVNDNQLTYRFRNQWRFRVGLQYSNELAGSDKHSLRLIRDLSWSNNWFINGAVEYTATGIFEAFTAGVSGGTTRGGYQCHMGSCRLFPDAATAMLTIYYRL
ncbi:MAG: hypothetical protein JXX14_21470 [Deltaproteobacteria bacterium]|nr:hypothetical protein [Deltaproteobacteria bacterium]